MTIQEVLPGTWSAMATLFSYPDAEATAELLGACRLLEGSPGGLADAAQTFRAFIESTDPTEREELFTTAFDINPTCTLELGWHLYGEDYKRGSFLVDMRQVMAALGIEESPELPDHLTHALCVLDRLPAPKDEVFTAQFVQPALAKVLQGYDDVNSPWCQLLRALLSALEARYGETQEIQGTPSAESQGPYEPAPSELLPRRAAPVPGGGGCSHMAPGTSQPGSCK